MDWGSLLYQDPKGMFVCTVVKTKHPNPEVLPEDLILAANIFYFLSRYRYDVTVIIWKTPVTVVNTQLYLFVLLLIIPFFPIFL